MALFGTKKQSKKITPSVARKRSASASGTQRTFPAVLKRPHITEKAAQLTGQNVFSFAVARGASKHDIVRAVEAAYKVTPIKIRVVNTPGKRVQLRTRRGYGTTAATRKAYIYLKKGDTIDFA